MKLYGSPGGKHTPGHLEDTASFAAVSGNKKSKKKKSSPRPAERAPSQAARTGRAAGEGAGRPAPKRRGGALKGLIIALAVVAALLAAAAGAGVYVSRMDTIYPKTSLDGIDLGGLTRPEAAQALRDAGWERTGGEVTLLFPAENSLTVTAAEAGAEYTAEDAAEAAYESGHGGNILSCLSAYLRSLLRGTEVQVDITPDEALIRSRAEEAAAAVREDLMGSGLEIGEDSVSVIKGAKAVDIDVDEVCSIVAEALRERDYGEREYAVTVDGGAELDVEELYESVHREPADAYYDAETGEVVESVTGLDFDRAEAASLWEAADYGDTVVIPLTVTEPELSTEDVEEMLFRDELASVVTYLYGSTQNRIDNVVLAAKSIDGLVLAPGEQFDYNKALGERTTERGYKAAGAYSGGEVVQEVGGGICQVSSMVYYAALLSNLQIDTRSCHYFPVSYVNPGMDATVSWGGPEFRFTNDREWPIRIEAGVDESAKSVTVRFVGTDVDGSYVEMSYSTWAVYNNAQYPETATGYKAATYRNVYSAEGELISRDLEAYSEYHYHEEDIVYPTPTPTPTPTPSEPPPEIPTEPVEPPYEEPLPSPSEDPGYVFVD